MACSRRLIRNGGLPAHRIGGVVRVRAALDAELEATYGAQFALLDLLANRNTHDRAGERIRISKGETAAARRWVPINADLLHEITMSTPPFDQTGRAFAGTAAAVQNVMTCARQSAGIGHYHPPDFRRRWISLQVKRGVPITEAGVIAGHSQNANTWNVYSHVLLDE